MTQLFPTIPMIAYQGEKSTDLLSYRYYNPDEIILGKPMQEHLPFAVCYWHTLCGTGSDAFGPGTRQLPWGHDNSMETAYKKAQAMFEFLSKLNVPYFCFHDRDIAPEGKTWQETLSNFHKMVDLFAQKMQETGKKLLWGTANLFSHPRYAAGAATNPNPEVFAYAATQVKYALDATQRLNGKGYVLWGGREGYDTLLNTDLKRELDQLARFLTLAVDYKYKIGFKGMLMIEPKPCEPTKHQYDYDTATVFGFLQKYGLEKEFKVNIEANHATLAGHSFEHEIATALALDCFGSIDGNRGDPQNGWDTDQFPNDVQEWMLVLYRIIKAGGFQQGGINFDAKVRRQSIATSDLFYGHIGAIDLIARALRLAANMLENDRLEHHINARYQGWQQPLGQKIFAQNTSLDQLAAYTLEQNLDPAPVSGQQEMLENLVNRYC